MGCFDFASNKYTGMTNGRIVLVRLRYRLIYPYIYSWYKIPLPNNFDDFLNIINKPGVAMALFLPAVQNHSPALVQTR